MELRDIWPTLGQGKQGWQRRKTAHPTKSGPGRTHGQGVADNDGKPHRSGRTAKHAGLYGKGLIAAITAKQKRAIEQRFPSGAV